MRKRLTFALGHLISSEFFLTDAKRNVLLFKAIFMGYGACIAMTEVGMSPKGCEAASHMRLCKSSGSPVKEQSANGNPAKA
tara:strand:- start:10224 stop:10466 length:243 start_codon:yes stop_codon:yes gene_type:complete